MTEQHAPKRDKYIDLLFIGLVVSFAVSLSTAQIFAGLLLVTAFLNVKSRWYAREVKIMATLSFSYVILLTVISGINDGLMGILEGLHHTWTVTTGFSVAVLWPRFTFQKKFEIWIYPFVVAAVWYLVQYIWFGYSDVWKYGFHRAPYIFAILLIAPSLYMITINPPTKLESVIWIVFVTSIMALNSRGAILAWLVATLLILSKYTFHYLLHRRAVWAFVGVILCFFFFAAPSRWVKFDLAAHSSVRHRLVVWSEAIKAIGDKPMLGYGFKKFHPDYRVVKPEYQDYLRFESNPHNGYLMVLHATGVAGYIVMWTIYGSLALILIRQFRYDRTDRISLVAAANLLAIFVASLLDKTFFTTLPIFQAWSLAGLAVTRSALSNPNRDLKEETDSE
ncbi:MAG: O-antigen ligase family protein [Candidatus Lindowbacteria bacterium]|nr:O-antigen ligase family protein [Candidatus Lindowbacteria bacterium]